MTLVNILEELIYPAIDEIASTLDGPQKLLKTPETVLFGRGAILDSVALVSLIIAVEGRIAEKTGLPVTLANERAMSSKKSPFLTMQTFAKYIAQVLLEAENE